MRLFTLFILLLLLIGARTASAQELPWVKGKPLTWKDFAGEPDSNSTYAAVTSCRTKYSYHWEVKDTVYNITFKLENVFYTQLSWSKSGKRSKDLLHHEQLHFDINELFTRRLYVAFTTAKYTANFRAEIQAIFDKFSAEERDFQVKYDTQTIHSRDWGSQVVWEQFIHKELDALPRNY